MNTGYEVFTVSTDEYGNKQFTSISGKRHAVTSQAHDEMIEHAKKQRKGETKVYTYLLTHEITNE